MTNSPNVLNGLISKNPSQRALRGPSGQLKGSRSDASKPSYGISKSDSKYNMNAIPPHLRSKRKIPDGASPVFIPANKIPYVKITNGNSHMRLQYRQPLTGKKQMRNGGNQTPIVTMNGGRSAGRGGRALHGSLDQTQPNHPQAHYNQSIRMHYPTNVIAQHPQHQHHQQHHQHQHQHQHHHPQQAHLQRVMHHQQHPRQHQHQHRQHQQSPQLQVRLVGTSPNFPGHGLVRPMIAQNSGVQARILQSGKMSHQAIIQVSHQQMPHQQHRPLRNHFEHSMHQLKTPIHPAQYFNSKGMQTGQPIQVDGMIPAAIHQQLVHSQAGVVSMQAFQEQAKYMKKVSDVPTQKKTGTRNSMQGRALQIINPKSGKPINLKSNKSQGKKTSMECQPDVTDASDPGLMLDRTPQKESALKNARKETAEKKAVESQQDRADIEKPEFDRPTVSEEKATVSISLKAENSKGNEEDDRTLNIVERPPNDMRKIETKMDETENKEEIKMVGVKNAEEMEKADEDCTTKMNDPRNDSKNAENENFTAMAALKIEIARASGDSLRETQGSVGKSQSSGKDSEADSEKPKERDGKDGKEGSSSPQEGDSGDDAQNENNGKAGKEDNTSEKNNQGERCDTPSDSGTGDDSVGGPYMPRPIKQNRVTKRKKIIFTRAQLMEFQCKCDAIPKGFPVALMKEIEVAPQPVAAGILSPARGSSSSSTDAPETRTPSIGKKVPAGNVAKSTDDTPSAYVPTSATRSQPEVVPLAKTANRWQPSSSKMSVYEKLMQKVMGILNKLSPEKHEGLFEQLYELVKHCCRTTEDLVGICNQVFDKAVTEQSYAPLYAKLCLELSQRCPSFRVEKKMSNGKKIICVAEFRTIVLTKCEKEFQGNSKQTLTLRKRIEGTKDGDIKELMRIKLKKRRHGNVRFIGELFKVKLEARKMERVLHKCIQHLLRDIRDPQEEDIVCLEVLLNTAGRQLDVPKAQRYMDQYFQRIFNMSKNPKLANRLKFKCKDLIDLRRRKWSKRGEREPIRTTGDGRTGHPRQTSSIRLEKRREPASLPPRKGSRYGAFGSGSSGVTIEKGNPQKGNAFPKGNKGNAMQSATVNVISSKHSPIVTAVKKPSAAASSKKDVSFDLRPDSKDPQKIEKDVVELIREYFACGERGLGEAALCMRDLKSPAHHWLVVKHAILLSLEKRERERKLSLKLLVWLFMQKKMVKEADFEKGLKSIYDDLPFIREDHPNAGRLIKAMCPTFVKFKCISQEALDRLSSSS